jgi:HAE1 family hydrophobic/amphiphilic exporter-1
MLLIYAGLIYLTVYQFERTPGGFIPAQDQGYLITIVQLPPGSSLARTDAIVRKASDIMLQQPGVAHTVGIVGLDPATFTNAPNSAAIFMTFKPFEERKALGLTSAQIKQQVQGSLFQLKEALIFLVDPPPVRGIGNQGGWKLYVQDRRDRGLVAMEQAAQSLIAEANKAQGLVGVFTLFNTRTPRVFADIDRVKAEMLGVPPQAVFEALEVYLGSAFVNDFNFLGRTYRVTAQADGDFRNDRRDVANLRVRSRSGAMVPLASVITFYDITGPHRVSHYNLYPAAEVQGNNVPGFSTGQAIATIEKLAAQVLPDGFGYEWTELALQEKLTGNTTYIVFALAVVLVFLLLSAAPRFSAATRDCSSDSMRPRKPEITSNTTSWRVLAASCEPASSSRRAPFSRATFAKPSNSTTLEDRRVLIVWEPPSGLVLP